MEDGKFTYNTAQANNIYFKTQSSGEVLRVDENGDFFVKGNKVANDIEVYNAMRLWLKESGYLN